MPVKDVTRGSEVDERLAALLNNAQALKAVQSAVEGTIGPKGLDVMLVDRFGGVTVTNDGVSILSLMEVNHPAARMLVNAARAQEEEVGDGTTTAAIMAGTIVEEAVGLIGRGVPVARILAGLRAGRERALAELQRLSRPVSGSDDQQLLAVALVAGRGQADVARAVIAAVRLVGAEELVKPGRKLADAVTSCQGTECEAVAGVLLEQERLNRLMPEEVQKPRILCLDDALEPEEVEPEALRTEAGFARQAQLLEEFEASLRRLVQLGVGAIFAHRGVDGRAEEYLTEAGVLVIPRLPFRRLERVAEAVGARLVKRGSLRKPPEELSAALGRAEAVVVQPDRKLVRIVGGGGRPAASILVGATTEEVAAEREREAKDAAAAAQAALREGVVPGGGATELALARVLEAERAKVAGMEGYGLDCLIAALRKPLAQIVQNAGFNPLEKMALAASAQAEQGSAEWGIDCDSGEVVNLVERGILDPAAVKRQAISTAVELAEAILRVNLIIRKRDGAGSADGSDQAGGGGKKEGQL
ncbi:MAG: TCP-1/cpn60 chaperonin family protein [Bacillota bacterium]|nr:TCP-1/cpn60 chaperonin family protein [Bacillota bacterium]